MKTPEIFIPTRRLDLPLGMDDYVDLELIRESEPRIARIEAAPLLKTYFLTYPVWEPYTDGSGGNIHVEASNNGVRFASTITEDGLQVTPMSTDGITIRPDDDTIFSHGVLQEDNTVHVWWGITTFDLTTKYEPENLLSLISNIKDQEVLEYDKKHFSSL